MLPWIALQNAADEPTEPVKGVAPGPVRAAEGPKPDWLRVRATYGPHYQRLRGLMRGLGLHTICEEAKCPNIYECWEEGHGHLPHPRQHLHPGVRLLQRADGQAHASWIWPSPPGWPTRWSRSG